MKYVLLLSLIFASSITFAQSAGVDTNAEMSPTFQNAGLSGFEFRPGDGSPNSGGYYEQNDRASCNCDQSKFLERTRLNDDGSAPTAAQQGDQ